MSDDFRDTPTDSDPSPNSSRLAIEVRSLGFEYGGTPTLSELTFSVRQGERVAIAGPSGAGKSTLLVHLAGLLPDPLPKRGSAVRVFDTEWTRSAAGSLRDRIGLVFQNPDDQLFCPTVGEDVAFGPRHRKLSGDEVAERVASALKETGLTGYEDRPVSSLSHGERKRVALAGVFACRPDLLLMDEPFANLDLRSRERLLGSLAGYTGTLLLATHDLSQIVDLCDRVIILDGGRMVADGPRDRLLTDPILMRQHGLEIPWQYRTGG